MAEAFTWVAIDQPKGPKLEQWVGTIRHRVEEVWHDGVTTKDEEVWERLEPTFKRGDRVVLSEGMGDYSLGIYLGIVPNSGQAAVRFDGYVIPDGSQVDPYEMAVNFRALSLAGPEAEIRDEETMTEGYRPIRATLEKEENR